MVIVVLIAVGAVFGPFLVALGMLAATGRCERWLDGESKELGAVIPAASPAPPLGGSLVEAEAAV